VVVVELEREVLGLVLAVAVHLAVLTAFESMQQGLRDLRLLVVAVAGVAQAEGVALAFALA
jgi:hypothetical protein